MAEVKQHRASRASRISTKNQITLPVEVMRAAGLEQGERVVVRPDGAGRVVLEREDDVLEKYRGRFEHVWEPGEIDRLRDEWR